MDDKHVSKGERRINTIRDFTGYCERCGTIVTHRFQKEQLQDRGGGLYSGVFLHKSIDNKEIHAILTYFDEHLDNRGGEDSIVIQDEVSLETHSWDSSGLDDEARKLESNVFYEWLINEYICIFKNMKRIGKIQVRPMLEKILKKLKKQSEIYSMFALIYEKTDDPIIGDRKIIFDSKKTDIYRIEYSELKEAYQTLFDQIKTDFMEENEKNAIETLRKLGIQTITQWRDIVKLGLSEDVLHIIEDL